jgi:hypothetical protein
LEYPITVQEREVMLNAIETTREINVDLWTIHLQKLIHLETNFLVKN